MPDREIGGYANSNALSGPGGSIREISVVLSPAITTTLQTVEQTFTVGGVLAADRLAYMTTTSGAFATSATSGFIITIGGRVSAVSIVSIPFASPGTAATPTTSNLYVFGIASQRAIP